MQAVYGARAIQRSEAFSRLLTPRAGTTDQQKLELVNNYFNNLTYSEDPRLWGMMIIGPIRWSSSGREEGIAEDYSIAKYYTLMELGVDEKKLRLAYVKAIRYNQFHMVTLYFPTIKSDPWCWTTSMAASCRGASAMICSRFYSFSMPKASGS